MPHDKQPIFDYISWRDDMYDFLATNKLTGQSSPIVHKNNYRTFVTLSQNVSFLTFLGIYITQLNTITAEITVYCTFNIQADLLLHVR